MLEEVARQEDESGGATSPSLDADLRTVVHRAVKDKVVSITELALLVRDVNRLCEPDKEAEADRERSRRLQSR